jgi:hypothetical protein
LAVYIFTIDFSEELEEVEEGKQNKKPCFIEFAALAGLNRY